MTKFPCYLLACIALINPANALAKNYQQTIRFNIELGDRESAYAAQHVCFTTNDIFDKMHCGAFATNRYAKGPKNWQLFIDNTTHGHVLYYDTSCRQYLQRGMQRTPEQRGILTFRAKIAFSGQYGQDYLTDCRDEFSAY